MDNTELEQYFLQRRVEDMTLASLYRVALISRHRCLNPILPVRDPRRWSRAHRRYVGGTERRSSLTCILALRRNC